MKLKIRRDEASARETNEWLEMNDWFAELRDNGPAESAGHDLAEPAGHGGPRPETVAVAAPADWPTVAAEVRPRAEKPQRAVIGDQLRLPVAWCEMGSCIWYHADPAALGEADVRARAISADWRVDALGRLACPRCQQTSPGFRASRPVVRWDRDTALASSALRVAIMRSRGTAGQPWPAGGRRSPRQPTCGHLLPACHIRDGARKTPANTGPASQQTRPTGARHIHSAASPPRSPHQRAGPGESLGGGVIIPARVR